jgi:hypothetical protein
MITPSHEKLAAVVLSAESRDEDDGSFEKVSACGRHPPASLNDSPFFVGIHTPPSRSSWTSFKFPLSQYTIMKITLSHQFPSEPS